MTKANLTELEMVALKNLMTSGYGSDEDRTMWSFCATGGIVTKKIVSGVVSSLVKKGLVICQGYGEDATITVTPAGVKAYHGE